MMVSGTITIKLGMVLYTIIPYGNYRVCCHIHTERRSYWNHKDLSLIAQMKSSMNIHVI
uniref:Uncharacterized protein n=1 Tax=Rhizophora mucronata TaxID=61149 RepID=A0A2P2PTP8_RHIMU